MNTFSLRHAVRTLFNTPFVTHHRNRLARAGHRGQQRAIFSLFEQFLLRPLPVQKPERLVNLAVPGPKPGSTSCGNAGGCDEVFSYPMFRDLEAGTDAVHRPGGPCVVRHPTSPTVARR